MRGLITLVNDNHVDNYLKEILAFLYYGSIVNSRSKKVFGYIFLHVYICCEVLLTSTTTYVFPEK